MLAVVWKIAPGMRDVRDCLDLALSEQSKPTCVYSLPGSTKRSWKKVTNAPPFLALGDLRESDLCSPHLLSRPKLLASLAIVLLLLKLATHSILAAWGLLHSKWGTAYTSPPGLLLSQKPLDNAMTIVAFPVPTALSSPVPWSWGWPYVWLVRKRIKVNLRCYHKSFKINHLLILSVR